MERYNFEEETIYLLSKHDVLEILPKALKNKRYFLIHDDKTLSTKCEDSVYFDKKLSSKENYQNFDILFSQHLDTSCVVVYLQDEDPRIPDRWDYFFEYLRGLFARDKRHHWKLYYVVKKY